MPQLRPQYAFVAGELSPDVYGRPDLAKFDLGLALARNYFVNYRGGVVSRPGTQYVGLIEKAELGFSLQRFKTTSSDLMLLFGDNYMRVIQDGGYAYDSIKPITDVAATNPAVVTAVAHGFSSGELIYLTDIVGEGSLNNRYYTVANPTANTFELVDVFTGAVDNTAGAVYVSGGNVSRVYTLPTPFAGSEVGDLNYEQDMEHLIITGSDNGVYKLTLTTTTNWALSLLSFSPPAPAPTNLTLTPSDVGTSGVAFAVTAVIDGEETTPSAYALEELTVNYTTTLGSMYVTWDAVSGATEYNIYRSLVLETGSEISLAQEVGYLGRSYSPQFTDPNITPDFLKSPPVAYNPFVNSAIRHIDITAGGTGYSKSDTVTVTGGAGTGFVGYPVVNASGSIISVIIVDSGHDYTSPVVTFSGGTGATATATLTPASGNVPKVFKRFQQRGVYTGTPNYPITIFASRPGNISDLSVSTIVHAGDGYTFTLDSGEPKGIRHLVSILSGLLLMTDEGVTQLRAEEGRAVSGVNALAERQVYKGVSDVKPLVINNDVIFLQEEGGALNVMVYTDYTRSFELQDASVLSNHMLTSDNRGLRMEYVDEPFRLIHIPAEDGSLVVCAYERVQDVYGWSRYTTQGDYIDCVAIKEGRRTTMYYAVKRYLHGKWVWTIEREAQRVEALVEDIWAVDCGLSYLPTPATVSAQMVETVKDTKYTITATFPSIAVGDIIYINGGKLEVSTVISPTVVECTPHRKPTEYFHEGLSEDVKDKFKVAEAGEWSIGKPTAEIGGLWHLEGKTVSVLADGSAWTDFTVTGGKITLDYAATKIKIGLGYECLGRTMPLNSREAVVHGKRKRVWAETVRLQKTRGLEIGDHPDRMYEFREENDFVNWGDPVPTVDGTVSINIDGNWERDVSVYFRQRYPLPASILGFVEDYGVGDI